MLTSFKLFIQKCNKVERLYIFPKNQIKGCFFWIFISIQFASVFVSRLIK